MSKYSYESTKPKMFPQGIDTDQVRLEFLTEGCRISGFKTTLKKGRGEVREFQVVKGNLNKAFKEVEDYLNKKLVFVKIKGKNKSKKAV